MGNNIDIKEIAKMLVYMGEKHNEISARINNGNLQYSDMRNTHYYVENIKNTLNSFDEETRALILAEVESMEKEAGKEVKVYGKNSPAGKTQSACSTVIAIVTLAKESVIIEAERVAKPYFTESSKIINLKDMDDAGLKPETIAGGKEITGVEGLKPLYDDPILTLYAQKRLNKDLNQNLNAQKELNNVEVVDENAKRIEQYLNAKKYNMGSNPIEELDEVLRIVGQPIKNLGLTNDGPELPDEGCPESEPSAPNEPASESATESPGSMSGDGSDAL